MDKRAVKFAKGGSKTGQPVSEASSKGPKMNPSLPVINAGKPGVNTSSNGAPPKLRSENTLPSIVSGERAANLAPPPSGKSSRRMSTDAGPETAEFAYSKAVELALRKYGFWSSRPMPRGYNQPRYLEAEIPSLTNIYQDYVFMRKTQHRPTVGPPPSRDDFRPLPQLTRPLVEPTSAEPPLPMRSPVGRDTPMPKSLRSGAVSRFPSLAVEIRMKKPPRKKTAETTSSRSVSVVSMKYQ